ncbi:MAG: hypothetical protein ACI8U3_003024 [Brevundimonas sp.]|jgi:hypothetical protein
MERPFRERSTHHRLTRGKCPPLLISRGFLHRRRCYLDLPPSIKRTYPTPLRAVAVQLTAGALQTPSLNSKSCPWNLIRPVTLTGYSTESLTGPELREAIGALTIMMKAGAVRAPTYEIYPLKRAAVAHRCLEAGGHHLSPKGRQVIEKKWRAKTDETENYCARVALARCA